MKGYYYKAAITLLLLTNVPFVFSQNAMDTPRLNRALLRYFSGHELEEMASENSQKLSELVYYFTQSFEVKYKNCESCPIDYNDFFNLALYNMYEHESKRLDISDYTFLYRDNYKITLKGTQEMSSNLNGSTPTDLVNYVTPRAFPEWEEGDDLNVSYYNYKERVYGWARDFPEAYRIMTNSPDLKKVSIVVFKQLSEARKQEVMNSPNGYLIID